MQGEAKREWVTAAASRDVTPRVGLIGSNFAGGEEMDGRKIRGLRSQAALDAAVTGAQLDDMVRLAVELGGGRRGGLVTAVGAEDWVVVLARLGTETEQTGKMTDLRLVRSAVQSLLEGRRGRRFTIAVGAEFPAPAQWREWTWGGRYDGLSYGAMVEGWKKQHPGAGFELLNLNDDAVVELAVEGQVMAKGNAGGMYAVARTLLHCDRVVSVAPLEMAVASGRGMTFGNYLGFAAGRKYGLPKAGLDGLGAAGDVALDLYSFHPADYAIVGGTTADGGSGALRHNVVIAGNSGLAVDAVGAAVLGVKEAAHLRAAARRGYGTEDAETIWTRGQEISEVKQDSRKG